MVLSHGGAHEDGAGNCGTQYLPDLEQWGRGGREALSKSRFTKKLLIIIYLVKI
jgi:hypothetical protein